MSDNTAIQLKFTGVDIIRLLEGIMERNTTHYQSDFDFDRKMLKAAVSRKEREDRVFLWLCRRMGTWCLRERDIYIKDTREHITYRHYAEERDASVLGYALEVRGAAGGKVIGDVYALDYAAHAAYVEENAVALSATKLVYEYGEYSRVPGMGAAAPAGDMGRLLTVAHQPAAPATLAALLRAERCRRSRFPEGCAEEYLWKLWARI